MCETVRGKRRRKCPFLLGEMYIKCNAALEIKAESMKENVPLALVNLTFGGNLNRKKTFFFIFVFKPEDINVVCLLCLILIISSPFNISHSDEVM